MIGMNLSFSLVGAGITFTIKCIFDVSCLLVCSVWEGIEFSVSSVVVGYLSGWELLESDNVICMRIKAADTQFLFPGPTQLSVTSSTKPRNEVMILQ